MKKNLPMGENSSNDSRLDSVNSVLGIIVSVAHVPNALHCCTDIIRIYVALI